MDVDFKFIEFKTPLTVE